MENLARQITNQLHEIKIKDGTSRVVWKDGTPEELQEWFREVTSEHARFSFAQLDECYEVMSTLAYLVLDNDASEVEYAIYENDWASVYNNELLSWLAGDLSRVELANQAIQEGSEDIIGAIQMAMQRSREQMAMSFLEAMRQRTGEVS